LNVKRYKGIKNKSMKITSALRHFVEDGKDLVELMKLDDDCDDCIFIGISRIIITANNCSIFDSKIKNLFKEVSSVASSPIIL